MFLEGSIIFLEFLMEQILQEPIGLCLRKNQNHGQMFFRQSGGEIQLHKTWKTGTADRYASFRDHWNYDDVSEDCLRINVFTPAINDGKKRPVMVWIHGGGFIAGNGIEHDGYNGENLARFGDFVFCSLNHRLGPLGFANLAGVGGEKYASSGNVGMLDIVAALEWVRDNIANFGGDPGNVTIMGQSGGGVKVSMLTGHALCKRVVS